MLKARKFPGFFLSCPKGQVNSWYLMSFPTIYDGGLLSNYFLSFVQNKDLLICDTIY